ncbi:MAG: pitrilysin family protein, partial [Bacteroidota bacterium]
MSSFSQRTTTAPAGPATVHTLPTPVQDVVTWRGSFRTNPDFAAGEELLQDLVVRLLDKGTRKRDRFALAGILEDRGAQLGFNAEALRVRLSGRALKQDIPAVLELMAEQLREPALDAEEFEKARAQVTAGLRRAYENTGARASSALAHRLYPEAHPNFDPGVPALLDRLSSITIDDIRAYHDEHFRSADFHLVFVGDLDEETIRSDVRTQFDGWNATPAPEQFEGRKAAGQAGVPIHESIPDKANFDVSFGHAVDLLRTDPDFIPLYVGTFVLGGNFSARLMTIVRDEMGLTYGIRAGLNGFTGEHTGHFNTRVTLSGDGLEPGIAATRNELRRFMEDGITKDELAEKQETISGSFKVGLATTSGIAASLLTNIERGFGPAYLDAFP